MDICWLTTYDIWFETWFEGHDAMDRGHLKLDSEFVVL